MAGTNIEQYEGRGINYRALDDLFALNAKRQGEVSHAVWLQRNLTLYALLFASLQKGHVALH